MKINNYLLFYFFWIVVSFSACDKAENLSEEEDLATLLEGDWQWRSSDITLHFDDGKTQHVATSFNPGETVLSFEVDKIEEGYISGTLTNTGIFGDSFGTWSYDFADEEGILAIIYTSESPPVYSYRHLEFISKNELKMTLSDALLVQEYQANGLNMGSGPKVAGGTVIETYDK